MSTTTTAGHFRATHPDERGASPLRQVMALVRRNLTHIKRQPEMLTDVTIQPVIFVLLFAFVFGGSIEIPGVDYKEWLLPGIMAQTMTFSAFIVAVGLTSDIGKGIVDRLRSLPIRRSAVVRIGGRPAGQQPLQCLWPGGQLQQRVRRCRRGHARNQGAQLARGLARDRNADADRHPHADRDRDAHADRDRHRDADRDGHRHSDHDHSPGPARRPARCRDVLPGERRP